MEDDVRRPSPVLSKHNPKSSSGRSIRSTNAPEEKAAVSHCTAHVEYETGTGTMRTSMARATPTYIRHDHGAARWMANSRGRGTDGPMPQTREHVLLAARWACLSRRGVEQVATQWTILNCSRWLTGVRELLKASSVPRRRCSGDKDLGFRRVNGEEKWRSKSIGVMEAVDKYIPQPARELDNLS